MIAADKPPSPAVNADRIQRHIAELSTFGTNPGAQEIANIAPTGMLFVPSVGGVSHSPKEFTSQRDMANGVNVLLQTVIAIDRGELR